MPVGRLTTDFTGGHHLTLGVVDGGAEVRAIEERWERTPGDPIRSACGSGPTPDRKRGAWSVDPAEELTSVGMATALNLAALMISLVALVVSILLTLRQIRLTNGGNHLPVILEAFKVAHDPESDYLTAERYLLNDLAREHSPGRGVTELPAPARSYALTIGMFFDDLGKVVAHGIVHQDIVVGSFGPGIIRMWDALAPHVYEQRRTADNDFWIYFEDLAVRAAARPNSVVYAALGLRRRPPRQEPHSSAPR